MKIYFTASLKGKKQFGTNYKKIVAVLENEGHTVYSEQILENTPKKAAFKDKEDAIQIYRRLVKMMKQADLVVAEVSYPSISVGHEVTLALEINKPVVVLYTAKKAPSLLAGNPDERLQVVNYKTGTLSKLLRKIVAQGMEKADVRFNFFVTPRILSYLDWLSKWKRVPRAVYLRNLIEKDMKYNKDYQKEVLG